jgi:predicted PurR-regulated permease PerM
MSGARPGTLRLSARSIALAVVGLGATLLALRMAVASQRVLGWIAAAAGVALILTPPIEWLHRRRVPRGLAVLLVFLVLGSGTGLAAYGVGASLVRQYRALQEEAPRLAGKLERSKRYGDVATDAHLVERTQQVVRAIPERLRGGTPAEAVRSATTRGIAFVVTTILSLFFVLHGQRLLEGLVRQLPERHRDTTRSLVSKAMTRGSLYALLTVAEAVVAGLAGYAVARGFALPGAAALGLWVGLLDVVPLVGAFVGALPIVLIAGFIEPWHGVVAALLFVAYQVAEAVLVQPWVERRSIRLGPFLTTLGGAAGLEIYGLGGALVLTLALALVVAVAAEAAELRAFVEHQAPEVATDELGGEDAPQPC